MARKHSMAVGGDLYVQLIISLLALGGVFLAASHFRALLRARVAQNAIRASPILCQILILELEELYFYVFCL